MSVSSFGVTYTDIEKMLRGYPLDDVESDIDELILMEAALLEVELRHQGLLEAATESNDGLYKVCRLYLRLRVAAEVGRSFTHQNPELSTERDRRAGEILDSFRQKPESMTDGHDNDTQRGTSRWLKNSRIGRARHRSDSYFGD